ncbi:MAG TPA: VWA domain-containing protein [Blastocatellia bacterium]|nr:VWA domain-containing protein [Blastocatellia bacterium]
MTKSHRITPLLCCLGLLTLIADVNPQSGRRLPSNNKPDQGDILRLRADEVLLNVTVTDSFGRQATTLGKSDFIIAEDGQRQDISSFFVSAVPVSVVLLLDASGSVVGEIGSLRDAAMGFVNELRPEDKVSVIEFHTKVELIQDWTSKADDLRHAISWRFRPGMVRTQDGTSTYGMTALYDALYLTTQEQLAKVEGRKAVIILTDGVDTSSKVTYEQALSSLIKSGAVVYVVSKARELINWAKQYTGGFSRIFGGWNAQIAQRLITDWERGEELMTLLSQRTGGQMFSPRADDEMKDMYARVARELKNQYVISYIPKNEKRDGGLRKVGVYLSRPGYRARSRDSYYAPKE